MKSKFEAAKEHSAKVQAEEPYVTSNAFLAGVVFAEGWISIDDELPEENQMCIAKIEFDGFPEETTYSIAMYVKDIEQWVIEIHYYFPDYIYKPTHYRPINRK